MKLLHLAFCAAALHAFGIVGAAQAQTYPERAVTLVYPFPPGSANDATYRLIADEAAAGLGRPIVFENMPGAGGRVGAENVMNSFADGYKLGIFLNAVTVNQRLMNADFKVEPGANFSPIVQTFESFLILVGRGDQPYKDFNSFVEYAKAHPGEVVAATAGTGTGGELGFLLMESVLGIDLNIVHYNGTAPAMQALMSGEAQIGFPDASAQPQIESGEFTGLMIGTNRRWDAFPEVPSAEEVGLGDFSNSSWGAIVGPAGMPADIVGKLNEVFNNAVQSPRVQERLKNVGAVALGGTPEELADRVNAAVETFRPIIEAQSGN